MPKDQVEIELQHLATELQKRQRHIPAPRRASEVVSDLLARRGYAQEQASDELAVSWQQAVGGAVASQSRVGRLRRGVLEVYVASSTLVQELSLRKRQVMRELRKNVPESKVRDLRFRVGSID